MGWEHLSEPSELDATERILRCVNFKNGFLCLGWGGGDRDGSQQGWKPDFFECISCGREDEGPKDAHVLIPRIREYLTLRPKGLWRCDELRTQRQEIVLDSWRWGHVLTTSL